MPDDFDRYVDVGGLPLLDAPRRGVVDRLHAAYSRGDGCVAFALHVGGLLHRSSGEYVTAMRHADLVYADGASVLLLGRLAGARVLERAATTDIGVDLLERLRADARPCRAVLIGGPPGLAERAGVVLSDRFGVDVLHATHGFHADWQPVLDRVRAEQPSLVIVGMGAPREMTWTHQHRDALGSALVLTCGGWFGFLAGEESRAPAWVQRVGLEWTWRLVQSPRRLAARYARGALVSAGLALRIAGRRLRGA